MEEGDGGTLLSAEKLYGELSKTSFRDTPSAFARQNEAQGKDAVMRDFSSGKIQLLISTTVVEVGVDVPNAVIMIIENADRFGLSQLHQLRGRVGRGKDKSTCILICDSKGETAKRRMDIMCKTCDDFKIADEDLKMRGPGDFFRFKTARTSHFKIADLTTDSGLVALSAAAAKDILRDDPSLSKPKTMTLKFKSKSFFSTVSNGGIS